VLCGRNTWQSIRERKAYLSWTIEKISRESGVGVRTVNRILRFSSIEAVMYALGLSITVDKSSQNKVG